jgi:hypothetical protein
MSITNQDYRHNCVKAAKTYHDADKKHAVHIMNQFKVNN